MDSLNAKRIGKRYQSRHEQKKLFCEAYRGFKGLLIRRVKQRMAPTQIAWAKPQAFAFAHSG